MKHSELHRLVNNTALVFVAMCCLGVFAVTVSAVMSADIATKVFNLVRYLL